MTVAEIFHEAVSSGILDSQGKTPLKTLNARLATDILKAKQKSRFMRSDASRFALRSWQPHVQERIVPRRQLALIEEDILVFDASQLRRFVPRDGFNLTGEDHHGVLSQSYSVRRIEAEERFDIIQLVSVYVVRHYQRYLSYKRTSRLPEKRLQHTYSCFFGGHLTASDLMPLFRFSDPEQALSLLDRELSEELRISSQPEIKFKGLLYDPRTQVSTQHLGIVFCVDLVDDKFEIGEKGFLVDPQFQTTTEMLQRIDQFENWSQLLIETELDRWN